MIKSVLLLLLCTVLLGCSSLEDQTNTTELKGIIADITKSKLLIIPDIKPNEIKNIEKSELIMLASDNDGIYFHLPYNKLQQFQLYETVIVKYDVDGNVEESDPPIYEAIDISHNPK